jgi:nitrite reductase/ring-hydroxylating ferredoxin subunit
VENAILLCKISDIPDGGAKGIVIGGGRDALDVIVLRRGHKFFAYVNRCPHQGTPLETFPDRFLDASCLSAPPTARAFGSRTARASRAPAKGHRWSLCAYSSVMQKSCLPERIQYENPRKIRSEERGSLCDENRATNESLDGRFQPLHNAAQHFRFVGWEEINV